jgi:site-specific DNA recombinase
MNLKNETERIIKQRIEVTARTERQGKAYVDGTISPEQYTLQLRHMKELLDSLVIPGINAVEEAGKLVKQFPELWSVATIEEKNRILLTMLDAVYFDTKESKSIVAIKPKPPFKPVFEVVTLEKGAGIILLNKSQRIKYKDTVFLVETGKPLSLPYLRFSDFFQD